ncbi:uncharacterized protein LOC118235506 isoform X2 [Anguilla anguilla]|uniref:uncharacterized protein LOC118235506 isoform X2 n=1 Tax=Anguilla anguilla TaxID=7936 RepID=UPI0015B32168|nr:uncharacterized protein LOC118235506 isoform X2 [Anguilla anguilla]
MEPFACLLLYGVCFQGAIFGVSWAWSVTVPREMEGMVGSCLVIPCRFSYSEYPPNDKSRVVWYQYVDRGYPLVCDPKKPNEVIEKFRRKTSLYGSPYNGDCSLKIDPLDWRHQEEKVYPWVDPDYVTYRYFKFYDKAVKIRVRDRADEPKLNFVGSYTVGEQMTVQCSAYHTCRPRPPTLRLTVAGHTGTPKVYHKEVHEGKWEITMEMTWILDNAHQTITCEVKHPSGRSASKTVSLKGQCSVTKVTINPSSEEFLEGVEKDVVCSVSYACQEQRPDLSWNYGGMKVSSEFKKRGSGSWESRSTLTFKAGASDHNQALKCTARFTNGQIQEGYITLKVKRAMFSLGWSFSMPSQVTGLQGSCLVIPCHFEYSSTLPSDVSVMWYKYTPGEYPVVYSPARPGDVISDFRGKTSLYGSPSDRSCSLKINPVEMNHHRQRLYTWVDPKPISSYHRQNYQDKTVEIYVTDRVDKPEMQIIGIPKVGEQISVQCSAYHTCPATPPKLSLIGLPETGQRRETEAQDIKWKTTLVQTWVIVEDQQTLSCRVRHPGGQEAQADITIQAECSVGEIITDPGPVEFLEGVVKDVTCSVFYTCSKQQPAIVWNYKDIPASSSTTKMAATKWKTVSSIMFIASMDDHGKTLTCTAEFPDGKKSMTSIDLHVKRAMFSLGWSFSMPSQVTGLQGSCLVIPCHFEYSSTLPSDVSVMWYKYTQVHGEYPVVYNPARPGDVISDFSGKTSLYGSPSNRSCSLKINPVEMNHHRQRLYTWVDPKPISSYHRQNYQDKTVEIYVTDRVDKPEMQIIGIPKVGEQISVQCSAYHMCPATPPKLSLIGLPETSQPRETQAQDVKWKITLVQTWVIVEDQQTVSCRVQHPGGQAAQADITIQAECSVGEIITDPGPVEFLEGVVKNVTCSVFYTCSKQQPAIVWSYKDMPASSKTTNMAATKWKTVSSIMFIASMDDHGKTLTCTAEFPDGKRPMASIDLHVKMYEPPAPESPTAGPDTDDTSSISHIWAASVTPRISALTQSCVVIPCGFTSEGEYPVTGLSGMWQTRDGGYAYHNGQSRVTNNFKGRTRLVGDLDEQNCTLEIDEVKPHDNGPFCFRAEKGTDKYTFNNSCVFIVMKASPSDPVMTPLPEETEEGSALSATCSVEHTCPTHPPTFTWNVKDGKTTTSHTQISRSTWKTSSTLTFLPAGDNYEEQLTCSATFRGRKRQDSSASLNVKRKQSLLPILLPATAAALLALALCVGVLTCRKRCSRRNPKDFLDRPPRPEKRRSIWSRFSRQQHGNGPEMNVGYRANNESLAGNVQTKPKPRCPSPVRNTKSAHAAKHRNDDGDNIYGNM